MKAKPMTTPATQMYVVKSPMKEGKPMRVREREHKKGEKKGKIKQSGIGLARHVILMRAFFLSPM